MLVTILRWKQNKLPPVLSTLSGVLQVIRGVHQHSVMKKEGWSKSGVVCMGAISLSLAKPSPCWWPPATFCINSTQQRAGFSISQLHFFLGWIISNVDWLVGPAPLTIRVFTTLQSDPRDFWPLRHLIRVMRRHDLIKKDPPTYLPTCLPTCLPPLENTLKERS